MQKNNVLKNQLSELQSNLQRIGNVNAAIENQRRAFKEEERALKNRLAQLQKAESELHANYLDTQKKYDQLAQKINRLKKSTG